MKVMDRCQPCRDAIFAVDSLPLQAGSKGFLCVRDIVGDMDLHAKEFDWPIGSIWDSITC